jgi:hypothetical protein
MDTLDFDPKLLESILGGIKQQPFKDAEVHTKAREQLLKALSKNINDVRPDVISELYTIVKETA